MTRLTGEEYSMFFITYLRRELRRRMRQAIFIALGLALGVGLVVTVTAAAAGVNKSETGVLNALYGVGTDVAVTGAAAGPPRSRSEVNKATILQAGPNGMEICTGGKCSNADGKTIELMRTSYDPISDSALASVARLHDVTAAAGGITLTDNQITIPENSGQPGNSSAPQQPDSLTTNSLTVDGVDVARTSLGPIASASLTSGHSFISTDADADVAVVDSGYAAARSLKAGSTVTIDSVKFTVIGIVRQPQNGTPPDIYVPLARAQALPVQPSMNDSVNTIYVTAASAADIPAVSTELSRLLPGATVTDAASLASEVTGSLASAAKLANDLGRWLAVLVLIAAFAVASLLTMAAVARRVAEFGTLKAIGWRTRRIVAQVLGESVVMGIAGAAVGVGLGFAGAAIIAAVAPKLPAGVPSAGLGSSPDDNQAQGAGSGPAATIGGSSGHAITVPLHPSITVGVIVLAVILAVAGGLLAGSLGSWRIARLRPADALSRVA
jgi:putative ABC transport system permease protein